MRLNVVGAFIRNAPFGTEIAFKKGLERVGVSVNPIDTSYPDQTWDMGADATLVFKWMEGYWDDLRRFPGMKIVYQPDDVRFPHIRQMAQDMRQYCDYFLSFDRHAAQVATQIGYLDAQTLLLTADDELYCPDPSVPKDIDVSFIGSLTPGACHQSRRRMCEIVHEEGQRRGWRTVFGSTEDIPKLVDVYRRSRVVLNHATDVGQEFGTGFGLQCRHFEVGMTRTALISNDVPEDRCTIPFYRYYDRDSLVQGIEHVIERHEKYADSIYSDMMARHLPQHRAAELVKFIERNSCG